jgi:hypothetical protein
VASQDSFDARLVVRNPGQDNIQAIITDPSTWEATLVYGILGENALSITIDVGRPDAAWLLKAADISVEVNTTNAGTWTEPHNCRFVCLGSDRDKTARQGRDLVGKLVPYSWLLTKAVLNPVQPYKPVQERDTRRFRNRNAGQIVNAIMAEVQGRGWCSTIKSWATGYKDSNGQPWADPDIDIDFPVGMTVLDAINQLVSEGHMQARMNGRNLHIYNPNTPIFPYETNTTRFRTGEDILTFKEDVDRSQRATHALLIGDSSTYYLDAESPTLKTTEWGPWGAAIQTGGTIKKAMLRTGKAKLDSMSKVRVSNEANLVFKPDSPFPFRHYNPGDYVTVNPADGPPERVRIMQMKVGRSNNGLLSGSLTFGTRKLANTTRIAKAVRTVAPAGVTAAGNGATATLVKPRPNRYDVTALGADANGVDPDDDAVAEVLTQMSVPGDQFFVPTGTNLTINAPITFNTTARVEGGGTITQRTPGQPGIVIGPAAHGSIVRDVILNGTGFATLATGSYAIKVVGTSASNRLRDVLIDNVAINNWQQYGVYSDLADNLEVAGCEINGIHYAGIGLLSPRGFKVVGNKVATIQGLATNNNGYGIFASRLSNFSEADRPQAQQGLIGFNTVDGVPTWEGIDTHAGVSINIIGNKVYNTRVAIAVVSGVNQAGVAAFGAKNIKVIGNECDAQVGNGTRGPGIIVQGAGTVLGEWIDPATAIVVDNFVRNHGLQDANINGGIQLYWTHDTIVAGNDLFQCSPEGVAPFHSNKNYKIVNNTFTGTWSTADSQPSGIRVPSNYNTGGVGGNTMSEGSNSAAFKNVYGFNSTPVNATNVVYELGSNDFRQSTQQWRDLSSLGENRFNGHKVGFRGAAPVAIPVVTGSRGGNAALASLLTGLANQGLITNNTTA